MSPRTRQARVAGLLYFCVALTGPFGLLYVPSQLFVPGNPEATAERLRHSEHLLRAGIAADLIHQVLAVFLVLALYGLFRDIDGNRARQVVAFGALLSVPIMFINALNWLGALALAAPSPALLALADSQRDALSYLFMQMHQDGIALTSIFWGLWLFPLGLLVIQSGFVPPWLGWLLLIAGAGYLIGATSTLLLPRDAPQVTLWTAPLQFGELPIIFWLLIWGTRKDATPRAA